MANSHFQIPSQFVQAERAPAASWERCAHEALARADGCTEALATRLVAETPVAFELDARARETLWPALAHLAPTDAVPEWRLSAVVDPRLPALPLGAEERRRGGLIESLEGDPRYSAWFGGVPASLSLLDSELRRGLLWYGRAPEIHDRGAPFLRLLAWLLRERGWMVAHAAVVARGDRALLLPGAGGTGKTTTSLAAWRGGWDLLGDDYVAVSATPPRAATLFRSAKLTQRSLDLLGGLEGLDLEPSGSDPKRLGLIETQASAPCLRALSAIVAPRLAPASGPARPIAAAQALRALAPSTLFQIQGGGFEQLASLARALPAFELPVGPDLGAIPLALDRLLAGLEASPGIRDD